VQVILRTPTPTHPSALHTRARPYLLSRHCPHAQHTRTPLHPAALASVPYGVVLVRVRVRSAFFISPPTSLSHLTICLFESNGDARASNLKSWFDLRVLRCYNFFRVVDSGGGFGNIIVTLKFSSWGALETEGFVLILNRPRRSVVSAAAPF